MDADGNSRTPASPYFAMPRCVVAFAVEEFDLPIAFVHSKTGLDCHDLTFQGKNVTHARNRPASPAVSSQGSRNDQPGREIPIAASGLVHAAWSDSGKCSPSALAFGERADEGTCRSAWSVLPSG